MVYVIDGMSGAEACYYYSGFIGIYPAKLTLRQLWRMASGKLRQRRFEMVEFSSLIWGMDGIDIESYLFFGSLESTGKGGPVQVNPELQSKIDEEIERLRREDPTLPKFGGLT